MRPLRGSLVHSLVFFSVFFSLYNTLFFTKRFCFLFARCRLTSRVRAQSPSSVHHYSPTRHLSKPSTDDKKADEKNAEKMIKPESKPSTQASTQGADSVPGTDAAKSKSCKGQTIEKHLRGSSCENGKSPSPDRKGHMSPKVDHTDRKVPCSAQNGDKKKGRIQFGNVGSGGLSGRNAF